MNSRPTKWSTLIARVALLLVVIGCASPSLAGDVFNGKTVYTNYCSGCHGTSGKGEVGNAPDFSRGEGLRQSDLSLYEKISNGAGAMPAYRGMLTDQEILDVIAFIRVLL